MNEERLSIHRTHTHTYLYKNWNPWVNDMVNNCHLRRKINLLGKYGKQINSTNEVVEVVDKHDDLVWFDREHNEAYYKLNHSVYHLPADTNRDYWRTVLLGERGRKYLTGECKLTTEMSFFIKTIMTIDSSIAQLGPT